MSSSETKNNPIIAIDFKIVGSITTQPRRRIIADGILHLIHEEEKIVLTQQQIESINKSAHDLEAISPELERRYGTSLRIKSRIGCDPLCEILKLIKASDSIEIRAVPSLRGIPQEYIDLVKQIKQLTVR